MMPVDVWAVFFFQLIQFRKYYSYFHGHLTSEILKYMETSSQSLSVMQITKFMSPTIVSWEKQETSSALN